MWFGLWVLFFWQICVVAFEVPRVLLPAPLTITQSLWEHAAATAFSSTVSSPLGIPIAVERTMRWDATGYGMHTEKAAAALARDWFFAEGAQGFYDTFYLLTNPTPEKVAVGCGESGN